MTTGPSCRDLRPLVTRIGKGALQERRNGQLGRDARSTGPAPSRSWMSAAWDWSLSARPSVSTSARRLRPLIFFPAS